MRPECISNFAGMEVRNAAMNFQGEVVQVVYGSRETNLGPGLSTLDSIV